MDTATVSAAESGRHRRAIVVAAIAVALVCACSREPAPSESPAVAAGTAAPSPAGSTAGTPVRAGTGGAAAGNQAPSAGTSAGGRAMNAGDGAKGGAGTSSEPAGSSGTSATAGNGGTGGLAADGGASGAGAAGGGPDAGAPDAGPSGDARKACHSTSSWTPAPGDLWIAPTGSDAAGGSEVSPKKTLSAAIAAWSAGKTIWVMPGTYAHDAPIDISTQATSSGSLRISGVTGGAKPVFDFSGEPRAANNDGARGIQLSGSYVHLRYLEIRKAADNCVYVTGSNNTLEWLTVYECQDTGVQLSNGAASNKVLNVDSYLNSDPTGENADGFAPKLSIGRDNYFCGTRAYHNADDGYDCWASGDASPVTFEYCWAFGQPGPSATAAGDGNGFKLGSPVSRAAGGNAPHKLIDCFAFHNRSAGFTSNGNSSGEITCTNCGVWANGTAWSPGGGGQLPKHTGDITTLNVSIDQAIDAPRDAQGNLPDISKL